MNRYLNIIAVLIFYYAHLNAQTILNGNFDQGPASGWTQYSQGGFGLIGTADFFQSNEINPPVFPRSGLYMSRIGGFAYEENYIKQTVTLPNTPNVYMHLYYQDRASTTSECGGLYVGAQIRIFVNGQVVYDAYMCYYNTVNEWTYAYLDLSSLAGQAVEIGFRADAANSVWSYLYLDDLSITSSLTAVKDENTPSRFNLEQNYPNPFNPSTKINYEIPEAGHVKIVVTDLIGEQVTELVNDYKTAGVYEIRFDGSQLSSGIYFYRMETESGIITKKMTLLK